MASAAAPDEGTLAYLTVFIGDEEYAFPMNRVVEIVPWREVTRLPSMPAFIEGLASVQNAAVPVVDLSARFGARADRSGRRSIVVVSALVRGRPTLLGVSVSNLGRLTRVAPSEIQPPPGLRPIVAVEYLTGVFRREARFVLCLDVDRVLGADEYDDVVARVIESAAAPSPVVAAALVPFLCVRIAGERCAFAVDRLQEILNLAGIAKIPGTPPFVLGATNVRGVIAPVLDIGVRFGLPASERGPEACLVLVEIGEGRRASAVGVLVESVEGWVRVEASQMAHTPPFGTGFPPHVVTGMLPVAGGLAPVLDVERVLSPVLSE